MKFPIYTLLFAGLSQALQAQTAFFVKNGCGVDDTEMGQSHYIFEPSDEATQIIRVIMDANFLEPNFTIKSGDVDNALATFDGGNRYIIYNTAYVERIKQSAGTDWAAFFVFAHEIGHHLSNHRFDLSDETKSKEQELKADIFAGGMLYRLGASLDEAQAGVGSVCKENGSRTHPPRRARLEAVASGWKKAKDQSGGVQPAPVKLPNQNTSHDDRMVFVKGGTYKMGCLSGRDSGCVSDESPAHSVTLYDFYIGKYEVTVAEYLIFADETRGNYPEWLEPGNEYHVETGSNTYYKDLGYSRSASKLPIVGVSWDNAKAYCQWLNDKKPGNNNYRLPTEAEWEFAARGGTQSKGYQFSGGDILGDVAWFSDNSGSKTHPVGQKKPNELGLYDMSGNVWEWCFDWYDSEYYSSSPAKNPTGPSTGVYRVLRGGSWGYSASYCRAAGRGHNAPANRGNALGFRLARSF